MFKVTNKTPTYQPEQLQHTTHLHAFPTLEHAPALCLSKNALETIRSHVRLGKETLANQIEQGGFLLGRVWVLQKTLSNKALYKRKTLRL